MALLRLYPPVKVIGQDFSKCKVLTVPGQSLTLREILARFVRRESLPVSKDGFYSEDLGDIEKMAKEDISVNQERIRALKSALKKAEKKAEAERREADRPGGPVLASTPEDPLWLKSAGEGSGGVAKAPPSQA